jgi:hypothetical protein
MDTENPQPPNPEPFSEIETAMIENLRPIAQHIANWTLERAVRAFIKRLQTISAIEESNGRHRIITSAEIIGRIRSSMGGVG